MDAFAHAIRLNPVEIVAAPVGLYGIAAACAFLGRYEEGAGWARKVLSLQPKDILGLFALVGNTYLAGRLPEAKETVAQMKQYHPHLRSSHLRRLFVVRRPADIETVARIIAFIGLPE